MVGGDNGHVPRSLRVLTVNVRQLKDDREALLAVLRRTAADVVAVQEPPRGPWGPGRLRRLARQAGFVPAVLGGGARTTALLVHEGVDWRAPRAVRLSWRPGSTRRGLAVADVAGVRVISAHLSLTGPERLRHADRLLRVVASSPGPCVVAGDLNEEPGGPTWRTLLRHLNDVTAGIGPTFPARRPRRRLDAVLVTGGLTGSAARVVRDDGTAGASDHLPVVVDLAW